MKEREIIAAIAEGFGRSPSQRNECFTSDAEIIDLDGSLWAITIDDYSAEDRFPADDPTALGWNLAVATMSDLLAVGARPRFMLNSLVTAPHMEAVSLRALSAGVQEALTACGAHMLGGDVGTAEAWRFTGVALGSFGAGRAPLRRLVRGRRGAVVVSGSFGDANMAAIGAGPGPRLELRLSESAALAAIPARSGIGRDRPGAADFETRAEVACIDTSDGLVSALETLCVLEPGLWIEIDLAAIPYAPGLSVAASSMGVPSEIFLMGSAGEYELVALVPEEDLDPLARVGMRRIGSFEIREEAGAAGLRFRRNGTLIVHPGLPDPRESASFDDYCATLIRLARTLFPAPAQGLGPGPGEGRG